MKQLQELETQFFKDRDVFREWLHANHASSPGIWMIYYKKHLNIECISYDDAVDEALCFGWIDSLIKHINDGQYARKFTPRKDSTKWSGSNISRVYALIETGKMMQAGLDKASFIRNNQIQQTVSKSITKTTKPIDIPAFILEEFGKNEPALTHFNNMAPSHQRQYVLWITNAKKEETVRKRIGESIRLLIEKRELGLK